MAKKTSQLSSASALQGTELLALVQGGQSKKTTVDDVTDRALARIIFSPVIFDGDNSGDTAVTSDIAALFSNDGYYLFPPGDYACGHVAVSNKNLTIDFAEGAVLKPAAGTDIVWDFTNCNITIRNFNADGANIAQTMIRMTGGTLHGADNVRISNMGRATTATNIVTGMWLKNLLSGKIGKAVFKDFQCVGNGTYGDGIGACRGIYLEGCGWMDIDYFEMTGGTTDEDSDYFQAQLTTIGGCIKHFVARYNEFTRRCIKIQSGNWTVLNLDIRKGADFTAVDGTTEVGVENLNCIDYSGTGVNDSIDLMSGYIDASGFVVGVANTGTSVGGQVKVHSGVTLKGPILDVIRNNPETGAPQNQTSIGVYGGPTAGLVGIEGAKIVNWGRGIVLQGNHQYCVGAEFIDPVAFMGEVGSSTQKSNIKFSRNRCRTQTSGYLNSTRILRVFNVLNAEINDNELIQDGNTGHATRFIDFTDSNATGRADGNKAPSGTTVVNGTAVGLEISRNGKQVLSPSVSIAAIGNVGTGEDNLRTYSLLAGRLNVANKGIRVTAWGTCANNGNAKTLKFYFGSAALLNVSLTTGEAGRWHIEALIFAASTDAQDYVVRFRKEGTTAQGDIQVGSTTEDDGATIVIKCTGEATSNNDIVQEGLLVESLTGNTL